ncbi:MAG: 50S ribosomal protein L23 [Candidatus Terrybacteria bacterium RIFCSPHIGHO2_01_FULL_48_17]|uniref:Large ribosomal subunit protein uL23 n=1 Tax=Candidatus Terrybacteria bacterium RIFCSPHIGHO2_01_FULL_48_17 TaxID=1802362 RepID=A0A1G2PKX7_9BACT|nr:MAG: 50S ribosomal protein L23 [Candidatus Terrybacteria bacterium RIFCSPHIGHO2_01_FULL_48_17]OHA52877.1 MAG: 50S ribosomal protein L23 [Candidatus Terrybacteria bacterium RIFCSPLOWO2_01_FULL_48_14]
MGGTTAHGILLSPHVTEKAGRIEGLNQYMFRIARGAKKSEVLQAVSQIYGVRPTRINIINLPGKSRRRGSFIGKKSGKRKAIVTLPEGKTIEVLPK